MNQVDIWIKKFLNEGIDLDEVNEAGDKIKQIADIIRKNKTALVDLRPYLEKIFKKKDIDFIMSPVAHFRIKDKGKTIIIVNKKYISGGEEVVGEIAIGYE